MKEILLEPHVDSIRMPENLKIGLMVSDARKKCQNAPCPFEYYGLAFGQSPFHVPEPVVAALAESAGNGHYSDAEGIEPLREAISSFNKRHFNLDVEPGRIVVGPGTKTLIHMIFDIVKGDVIIPSPSWIGYFPQVKLLDKRTIIPFGLFFSFGGRAAPSPDARNRHVLVLDSVSPPANVTKINRS